MTLQNHKQIMQTDSKTPLTDAEARNKHALTGPECRKFVPMFFCRDLEMELTAERAHADRLAAVIAEMLDCGLEGPRKQDIETAIEALTAHEARRTPNAAASDRP